MKFPKSTHLAVSLFILIGASHTAAETLDVGLSRTPTLSNVPTIALPKQHDNTVGQAFSSASQSADQIVTEKITPVESVAPPRTPTMEITRGGDGMTISKPQETVPQASKETHAPTNKKPIYITGMILTGTAKVFDGHSFLIDNHPVRLNGVDAPGLKQICTSAGGAAWRCGEAARAFLKRLIDGKRITCLVDAPAGAGAAVTCSGKGITDVTRMVVNGGMAVINGHGLKFADAQSYAQKHKTGLWVGNFTNPNEWRLKNP